VRKDSISDGGRWEKEERDIFTNEG